MIDTHCHLTYDGLQERLDDVLSAARAAEVDRMITVGTTPEDAMKACTLAQQHPHIFFAVGLHPHYALQWPDHEVVAQAIRSLSQNPKCVAIGEMGLDRHYSDPPIEDQKRAFSMQLDVIRELDRSHPKADRTQRAVIIHNREATDETLALIRASGLPGDRFVFHCFTGSDAELTKILDLGAMVSFTGIVTFKNAAPLAACAKRMPADRLMIETDSPYLAPEPHRKVRPNEPRYVADVARFLARVRAENEASFIEQVDANAVRFFGLK